MITKQARWIALVALAATPCAVIATKAQALGQHPAVLVNRAAPKIDTNTFLVQPPATTAWTHDAAAAAVLAANDQR